MVIFSQTLSDPEHARVLKEARRYATGLHMSNNKYPVGEATVPSSDPNWNYNDPEHMWERDHLLICVKAGPKAAQKKVISYAWVSAITQEPYENPIAFLERLKEALEKFTNLDSYERQVILKGKFLYQCASHIRMKLQQQQQQDVAASFDEMVQTDTNTFYTREQERPRPRRGRKAKRQGMPRC